MPSILRVSLSLVLLLSAAPAFAADAPIDPALEARIVAMGKVHSASAAQYSPDGRQIAYIGTLSGSPQAWILPTQGGEPRQLTTGSDPVSGLRWSPDGKLAYAVSPGGGYNAQLFIGTPDGAPATRINESEANTFPGDFAPDGRYYISSNARSANSTDTWLYDPATGKAKLAVEMETVGEIDDMQAISRW